MTKEQWAKEVRKHFYQYMLLADQAKKRAIAAEMSGNMETFRYAMEQYKKFNKEFLYYQELMTTASKINIIDVAVEEDCTLSVGEL